MLNKIDIESINKYKRYIPFDMNTNSKLYFDKDIIHKLPYSVNKNLYNVLNYINEIDLKEIIKLTKYIYDNETLVGYSFINYKEYKSLNKFKNRDINLKLEDSFKITEIFNKLFLNNIIYNDFHTGNILLNKDTSDIKICDLDNVNIINDKSTLNSATLQNKLIFIMCLILSYLYDINNLYMYIYIRDGNNVNKDNLIKKYYINLINGKLEDFSKVLSKLDLDLIEEEKSIIKVKSKKLKNNSYYRKYFL